MRVAPLPQSEPFEIRLTSFIYETLPTRVVFGAGALYDLLARVEAPCSLAALGMAKAMLDRAFRGARPEVR